MASRITVRFFQVVCGENSNRKFSDALEEAAEPELLSSRKRTVSGVGFRLERFEAKKEIILGEMTRIQDDNLPAAVHDDGLEELDVDELGYGVAFLYDSRLDVLAIQYNPTVVSPGRIGQYLEQVDELNNFHFLPIPGPDSWTEFAGGQVTRFKVKLAVPTSYRIKGAEAIGRSTMAMARAYDSPYVTIELSVGHKKMSLGGQIKETARQLLGMGEIESMRAKVVDLPEEIDLMEQMLHYRDEVEVPSDPDSSYRVRSNFVSHGYRQHHKYLVSALRKR